MTIGQLARRAGVRPSAIRYYETRGVLLPSARSTNAYRLYGPEALTLLRFVLRSKELGFSLGEVRQIIAAAKNEPPCTLTRKLIESHLSDVEAELGRLRALRNRLKRLLDQPLPGKAVNGVCPLIDNGQ